MNEDQISLLILGLLVDQCGSRRLIAHVGNSP
jgi:hypothetical protein